MTEITETIKTFATEFNRKIDYFFPFPSGDEQRVSRAMHYSLSRGGKRLRPFLMCETAALFGVDFAMVLPVAMALEMLHTYSLIHDDLPAMDNDDLRRGFPTCHKQFDEATAIIAGDGLLTYAFEIISRDQALSADIRCRLIAMLGNAAGAFDGMVAGQMLDILSERAQSAPQNPQAIIKHIEEMKTGRLLRYAVEAGAVIGGANQAQTEALVRYSRDIGIAFQIADDILDVVGSEQNMGKTLHKDAAQNKLTFVSLYGLDNARQIAADFVDKAVRELNIFGPEADNLRQLAHYIINRQS